MEGGADTGFKILPWHLHGQHEGNEKPQITQTFEKGIF
jgi:hypothetical protein